MISVNRTTDLKIHLARHGRASEARPGHPGIAGQNSGAVCALALGGRLTAGHDDGEVGDEILVRLLFGRVRMVCELRDRVERTVA